MQQTTYKNAKAGYAAVIMCMTHASTKQISSHWQECKSSMQPCRTRNKDKDNDKQHTVGKEEAASATPAATLSAAAFL
jgi:hypothetical protein